jgi:hypothetical protein
MERSLPFTVHPLSLQFVTLLKASSFQSPHPFLLFLDQNLHLESFAMTSCLPSPVISHCERKVTREEAIERLEGMDLAKIGRELGSMYAIEARKLIQLGTDVKATEAKHHALGNEMTRVSGTTFNCRRARSNQVKPTRLNQESIAWKRSSLSLKL